MLQSTSRIESDNGIKFYEKDILYDDYVYENDIDIEIILDYFNNGFGILFMNNEGSSLNKKNEKLLFKLDNKALSIIYKSGLQEQINVTTVACYHANPVTENLKFKISKRNNIYTVYVNEDKIITYTSKYDITKHNIGYYSNKDNIIKNINIASAVPYNWITNMRNTNGGYILFNKDGFELIGCKNNAEIEQINIELTSGKYYLKYNTDSRTDIVPYLFYSNDERINDNEKNILAFDNSFIVPTNTKVSLKFVGTFGKISNIAITSAKNNEYIKTDLDSNFNQMNGTVIEFDLKNIKAIEFDAVVLSTPECIDYSPIEYHIISDHNKNYGLGDLVIALGLSYHYSYKNGKIEIRRNDVLTSWTKEITVTSDLLSVFNNVNGIIENLILTDINENETNITLQNTVIKYVPGLIKSPIVILDPNDNPLNISSSYRYLENNGSYFFTNIEREYFYVDDILKHNGQIKLEEEIRKDNSIVMYGIPRNIQYDITKLLNIKSREKDNIGVCCNDSYHTFNESNINIIGTIDYSNGVIFIKDTELLDDYELIVVDYLKDNSYSINYNYDYNSYEVEVSTDYLDDVQILYDNTETEVGSYEYINEKLYYDTKITPSENCYIVIGR